MKNDLSKLFRQNTPSTQAPEGFVDRVLVRIHQESQAEARRQGYVWGTFFVMSLIAFIGSAIYAVQTFMASNFTNYFSLIFSEGSSVAVWWRELGLSLLESLPIFGICIFLASVGLFLWSIRKFSKYAGSLISQSNARTAY